MLQAPHDRSCQRQRSSPLCLQTHAVVLALLAVSTALFATLAGVDSRRSHLQRRAQWLAVLLGPLGALARWQLGQLNFKLPGGAKWFPLGTFLANMAACCIDFALAVGAVKLGRHCAWSRA